MFVVSVYRLDVAPSLRTLPLLVMTEMLPAAPGREGRADLVATFNFIR
jgi:hypothetical protein